MAFKTGEYKQQVIFIGGLTDGLLATEYVASSPFAPLKLLPFWLRFVQCLIDEAFTNWPFSVTWSLLQLLWIKRNGRLFSYSCRLRILDSALPA